MLRRATVSIAAVAATCLLLPMNGAAAKPTVPVADRHPDRDWTDPQVAVHTAAAAPGKAAVANAVVQTPGLDVSSWQGNVNWSSVASNGARFASSRRPSAPTTEPVLQPAVHRRVHPRASSTAPTTSRPRTPSSGTAQADYFVAHGGGWSKDGSTFPGMLDIEWNPYGGMCYGKSKTAMTSMDPLLQQRVPPQDDPLADHLHGHLLVEHVRREHRRLLVHQPAEPRQLLLITGTMPYHWPCQTIWQCADHGTFPGDQDRFNGDITRVRALARG